ncbi:AAA family ATPase [Pararhodobacter sp. SW119]|uniref:ParA family protein n=1 Tax=Pararhodobacter sp. SW119 TaxID=2780075 RepID=UPI001ADF4B06|nr:AAA family ATPase [Pararhodobacter sp. SW119]
MQTDRAKILAIANQKGGVAKTTTAINLSAALAELGRKVLLIDLDPQGNASTGLGVTVENRSRSVFDILLGEATVQDVAVQSSAENVWVIPSTPDLSSSDVELHATARRVFLLRDALRQALEAQSRFDFIIVDCPPSLNLLTVNALVAADAVLVPLQCEFFALEGLSQLLLTIREIRQTANPDLRVEGVLLTMHDRRNNLSLQVERDARETLGDLVFRTVIPRNVRLSEAPSFAVPILTYDSTSRGAKAYRAFAREFLKVESLEPEEG